MPNTARIAIIPAKGRSRRLPGKNIKPFFGKPIIAYTIEAALKSSLFETVMVSTDDEQIAEIATSYGASVPFLRSATTSGDETMMYEVVEEVLTQYQISQNKQFDVACCLLANAVFITPEQLNQSYQLLVESPQAQGVMTVVRFSEPIQRALEMDSDGSVRMVCPEYMHKMSNDLPPRYHDGGQFYWITVDALFEQHCLYPEYMLGFEIPESRSVDMDTAEDWAMAEIKYAYYLKTNE